jgi:hypothetical protein
MERIVFEDERIWAVQSGAELTPEERVFLLDDTPRFEECTHSVEELSAMNDADLMSAAYSAWADYCR